MQLLRQTKKITILHFESNNQKPTAMGLLEKLQKGVDKFFDGLEKGAVDRITKKAKEQELSPDAKETMKEIDELYENLDDLIKDI